MSGLSSGERQAEKVGGWSQRREVGEGGHRERVGGVADGTSRAVGVCRDRSKARQRG